jgi:20S proteasome subunit beta 2
MRTSYNTTYDNDNNDKQQELVAKFFSSDRHAFMVHGRLTMKDCCRRQRCLLLGVLGWAGGGVCAMDSINSRSNSRSNSRLPYGWPDALFFESQAEEDDSSQCAFDVPLASSSLVQDFLFAEDVPRRNVRNVRQPRASLARLSLDRLEREGRLLLPDWWKAEREVETETGSLSKINTKVSLEKTGTTIVGICGPGFCILGADTRSSSSSNNGSLLVANPHTSKLHWLTKSVVAAGAGTSADLQQLTRQTALRLALTERSQTVGNAACYSAKSDQDGPGPAYLAHKPRVHTVCRMLQETLWQNQGNLGAHLIVGGVDPDGCAHLRALHPHGSMDVLTFTSLGSGSYAALGILESRYRADLTQDEALQLVKDAITAGILNDLGSGSHVDLCILTAGASAQYVRSVAPPFVPEAVVPVVEAVKATSGINGFGNGPVVIRKRATLYDPALPEQQAQEWRDLLGL